MFITAIIADLILGSAAVFIIGAILYYRTKSLFLSSAALFQISLAFPPAILIFTILYGPDMHLLLLISVRMMPLLTIFFTCITIPTTPVTSFLSPSPSPSPSPSSSAHLFVDV